YDRASAIARKLPDEASEHNAIGKLAETSMAMGKLSDAIGFYERQLSLARDIGDHQSENRVLGELAETYITLGEPPSAAEFYLRQINSARAIGHSRNEAQASFNLAKLFERLGECGQAIACAEDALKLFEKFDASQAEQAGDLLARLGSATPMDDSTGMIL